MFFSLVVPQRQGESLEVLFQLHAIKMISYYKGYVESRKNKWYNEVLTPYLRWQRSGDSTQLTICQKFLREVETKFEKRGIPIQGRDRQVVVLIIEIRQKDFEWMTCKSILSSKVENESVIYTQPIVD
jgi:hypothetical protein